MLDPDLLYPQSVHYRQLMRKFQIEVYQREVPRGAYVVDDPAADRHGSPQFSIGDVGARRAISTGLLGAEVHWPQRLELKAICRAADGTTLTNAWPVWVFSATRGTISVEVHPKLDAPLLQSLQAGARVLLIPDGMHDLVPAPSRRAIIWLTLRTSREVVVGHFVQLRRGTPCGSAYSRTFTKMF